MGDGEKAPLLLKFNPKTRLEFRGATITSDAGLLAFRELDDALDLSRFASVYLQESRTGQADQNRRTANAPCQEAGVSACSAEGGLVTREMLIGILERIGRLRLAPG